MNEKYYKEKLSCFVNHELPNDERQAIAEHLLLCADCRSEHDQIKFGAALASQLKQTNAPENLWNKIEKSLDGKSEKISLPNFAFFGSRAFAAMAGLLIICGLVAVIYVGFSRNNSQEIARNEKPIQSSNIETPQVISTPNEISANQKAEPNSANQTPSNVNSKTQIRPQTTDSNIKVAPKNTPIQSRETLPAQTNLPSWNVETLAGMPKVGNSFDSEKLAVGEFLETDANSSARVQVANIGNVEIAPNSRVKLVKTNSTEHRLSLEKGELKAKILAPPRLFIVDTPSAVAVDLGCEYTLEVDKDGNGKLRVTGGFVALERNGRESIVPAGAIALTRKGKDIGTPFAEDSSAKFQAALYKFDFENGGNEALQTIIKEANLYDSLTLWHLLSRVSKNDRGKVFNALANLVEPPANVTVEGVLQLDKKMLDAWWKEIENVWFE
jgi:FecR protein/Putative zinc-finger